MQQNLSLKARKLAPLGMAALRAALLLGLLGCEDPQVKKYTAAREKAGPDYTRLGSYQLPEGWTRMAQPVELSVASFKAGEGDNAVVLTITRFPGKAGGLAANIERWRGKAGLPSIDDKQLEKELFWLTVDGEKTPYVDLVPPAKDGAAVNTDKQPKKDPERILGVVAERGPVTWFFKMQGRPELVAQQKAKFEAFVQSIKFGGTGGSDG